MRLLLDTHIYLWWLAADPRLSTEATAAIREPAALVHVSAASIWEAAIKTALGRLDAGDADLVAEIAANGFEELSINARHAAAAGALPRRHEDPFDRMLVAQAATDNLTLVTADRRLGSYGLPVLWS